VGAIDPERPLRWLYPRLRWLFSAWFLALCCLLVVGATLLAAVEFDAITSRLPEFGTFFGAHNLVLLAVSLAAIKGIHELGHALTCRHFGGECHEIGLLLLVFTPCLYCNVSDAWLFASKWQRIAVSAAGVVVEVVMAACCLLLWWVTAPGLLNTLLLNMAVVASVSTLVFNGNPLMRYDGYYVLSDLLDVPNLAQQSRALLGRRLSRWCLGMELPPDRSLPRTRRGLVALYGVASLVYRWLVVAMILWLVYRAARPYGLEMLAGTAAVAAIGGMLAMPTWNLAVFLRDPSNRRRMRPRRAWLSGLAGLALLGAGLWVPLPCRVVAPAVIQPEGAQRVYVTAPGRLMQTVTEGQTVEAEEELARLVNLGLRKEVAELTSQRDQQRLQLENLRVRQASDPSVGPLIPAAEGTLADIEARLRERNRDEERLTLRAPSRGTVLPPPRQPEYHYSPGTLASWQGTPLESRAIGAHLETGTLFCLVGDPRRLEAFLVIDQAEMKFVRKGQRVRLQLDENPGRVLEGTIAEVAKTDVKVAPRELTKESDLLVHFDREGIPRPVATSYQAQVVLDEADAALRIGTRGRAKVLVDPQPLGQRLYRALAHLLRFGV
jgi:putative peptide zinc metalloprotease protein